MVTQDIKVMFENGVHIGHRTQKWNPKMKKFIFGEKNGVHLIDLERSFDCLEKALAFLSKLSTEGKRILFVSTKPQSLKMVEDVAKSCNMPYVISKWIPGLLTNFGTLKTRIKYLTDLKRQEETGEFEKYTKKEAGKLKKTIEKLEGSLGGVEGMMSLPDAIFVIDSVRDFIAIEEARTLHIPVVAITDTNADPTMVDDPIPGNDDAVKSLEFFLGQIQGILKPKATSKQK